MEEAAVKENVNPEGGHWGQSRKERKLRLGVGAQEPRSRERDGVLALNSTLGNCGDMEALEWLKDRVSQHKLVSKSPPELDSGSRYLRKLGSSAVDGKRLGALGKPSADHHSKKLGRMAAGRELSSFHSHLSPSHSRASMLASRNLVDHLEGTTKNYQLSSGMQVGAKSSWPGNRGVLEIYHDNSMGSQEQRDSNRREAIVMALEIKSPGAAGLLAEGSALRSEIEEHSKVSLNSPSRAGASKFQLQEDEVCVRKLSPEPSSHSLRIGLWSGSRRRGMPCKQRVHRSRNSIIDQPERSNRDQQFSSSGQVIGLKLIESENARTSVTSLDPPELRRREEKVEAVEKKSLGAADTETRSALSSQINEKGNQSFPANCEELKSRQQIELKSKSPRKSPNSGDSGRSSFDNKQGLSGIHTSPTPEKEEVASSRVGYISQCDGKNFLEIENEKDGGDFSVDLPYVSTQLLLRNVDHYEQGHKIDSGSLPAACETNSNYAGCYPEAKANLIFAGKESSPPPAKTQSASTVKAGIEAHSSPSEHVFRDDDLKGKGTNMDAIAVCHGSSLLSTEVTGASSSGSSSACITENCSIDYDTEKSSKSALPTPSAEKALSSYRLSTGHKLSRMNKRSTSLGPASRVLRDEVESCCSRISPVSVAPVIESDGCAVTAEKVEKTSRKLEYASSDPRKRKAERETSGREAERSQSAGHSSSGPASVQDKDTEIVVQSQGQSAQGPREMGSIHREHPSQLISKEDLGEFDRPRLPVKLVSRATKLQPRISATGRLLLFEKSSSVPSTSKAATRAYAGHQSRSKPAQNHDEMDASEVSQDSGNRRDRDGAEMKLSRIGESGFSVMASVSKAAYEIQNANVVQADEHSDDGSEESARLTAEPANLEDGSELVTKISDDGFSSGENKENVPIPVVPDLSSCLNSLSLGGEDILKRNKSKILCSIRSSPIPYVSSLSNLATVKSVGNCRAPLVTSHSARSVVNIETSSRDQVSISPCPSGSLKRNESAMKPSGSTGGELPINVECAATECNAQVKVRTLPSNKAQDKGASAQQPFCGTWTESGQGITTTSQKKMYENIHFVWVNNKRYQKLGKIGKGGSSEVYKVIDSDCNIYAMKKINLKGREHRTALGFYQEIKYLERLLGKRNVVQLIDHEVSNMAVLREDYEGEKILEDACIYMVLEFGEIDLASILSKKKKEMMESNEIMDDNWLRFYWKHMLLAVRTIHDERIVHADLKPANFLLVKGELKLIDFGIAKAIQNDTTHIVRDSKVGTLNYMSPEAFMTNSMDEEGRMVKCGRASDIWSLGCILYQMVYGHTPFSRVDSFYAKIQAITSKSHKVEFPAIPDPWLQDVMKKCLTWDRHSRPQITDLLEHPFLRPEVANQQINTV